MNKYVVGILSFFDNEIILEEVVANNELTALLSHSMLKGYKFNRASTLEDIQQELFNCDMTGNVIKIN